MSREKTEQSTPVPGYSPIVYCPLNEQERQINDDYEWCLHDPEVRRQYGGQVVVAHRRRIWGAGRDHGVAWDAALQHPDCPHQRVCAFVVVPPLVLAPSESSGSFSSTYSYLTEEEKKMNEDYEWCLNDLEVRRQYGDQVVAAHQRRIWGAGRDHCAALDTALKQPDCPPRKSLVLVVVPPLVPLPSTSSSSAT